LWNAKFKGGSQGAPFATVTTSASLAHLMTLYPSCATSGADQGHHGQLPLVGAVPACVSYIYVRQNDGLLNLDAQGVDNRLRVYHPTDNWGVFSIGRCGQQVYPLYPVEWPGRGALQCSEQVGRARFDRLPDARHIGWNYQNYGAQLFMNYTGGYQNWNSPDNAVVLNAALNPSSGGDGSRPTRPSTCTCL